MKKLSLLTMSMMMGGAMAAFAQTPSPGWFTKVTDEVDLKLPHVRYAFSLVDVNNDDYPDIVALNTPPGTDSDLYHTKAPFLILLNVADTTATNSVGRRFIDITPQSNINKLMPEDSGYNANAMTLVDVNNDGNVDLITGAFYYKIETYPYPHNHCRVFLGDGTGKFTYKPNSGVESIGLVNLRSISALDYDRDGNIDLYMATAFKDYTNNIFDHGYLLKGNGDGTFTDVTSTSGLGDYLEPAYSASVMDYNNDCWPDIFSAPYCRTGGKVFKNEGNGHFTNVAGQVGYDLFKMGYYQHACTFTTTPQDVDNDGNMDLFIAEVHGGNQPGQLRSTIAMNQGAASDYAFDIDPSVLPPTASYTRGDYDGAFIDFENDGLVDLVMTQGHYLPATDKTYFFHQTGKNNWTDATDDLGLSIPELESSATVEPFDINLDGSDGFLISGMNSFYCDLWLNNAGSQNNWIGIKLKPVTNSVNQDAIGARIYVYHNGKLRMQEIAAGNGLQGQQRPFILNFGIGQDTKVDSVIVRWPDHTCSRTIVKNPPINQIVTIENTPTGIGEGHAASIGIKVFPNPTSQWLVVQGEGLVKQEATLSLTDMSGRTLSPNYTVSDGNKFILNLSTLPDGVYMLTVTTKDGRVTTQKVVKR